MTGIHSRQIQGKTDEKRQRYNNFLIAIHMFLMRHNTVDRFLASCTVCQKIKSHRTWKQFCTIVSRVCYISIGLYRVVLAIYKIVSNFFTPSEDVTSIRTFETLFSLQESTVHTIIKWTTLFWLNTKFSQLNDKESRVIETERNVSLLTFYLFRNTPKRNV